MWTWLAHWLGLDNGSGPIYLWWSGVFSALPSFGVAGLVIGLYRRHNCHVRGCPRIGRHQVEGTGWVVCRHHHPDLPNRAPTASAVAAAAGTNRQDELLAQLVTEVRDVKSTIQRGGFGVPRARREGADDGR